MANSEEVIAYKNTIISKLVNSDAVIELIDADYVGHGDELIYKNFFPYIRVPQIEEEMLNYICFSVEVDRTAKDRYTLKRTITVTFYIIAHQEMMRCSGERGTRIDMLGKEIDALFNGSDDFGISQLELTHNGEINIDYVHRARAMRFTCAELDHTVCGDVD